MTLQEQYIQNNYKAQTVKEMAGATGLKYHIVRKIMIANCWENVNSRCKALYQPTVKVAGMFEWKILQEHDFIFKLDAL